MMCFYRPIARYLQLRHARAIFIGAPCVFQLLVEQTHRESIGST